jgi:hypothetical protein
VVLRLRTTQEVANSVPAASWFSSTHFDFANA